MTQKRSAALSVDAASLIEDVAITPGRPEVEARVRALTERAAREPRSWMLRLALAQAYAQNGDFAAAVAHLRHCRDSVSDPTVVAGIAFNLGVCLEGLEQWDAAVAAYEQCVALLPDLYWGRFQLGRAYLRLGRWEEAMREMKVASALVPEPAGRAPTADFSLPGAGPDLGTAPARTRPGPAHDP